MNILVVLRDVIDGLTYSWELQMCLPVSIPSGVPVLNSEDAPVGSASPVECDQM